MKKKLKLLILLLVAASCNKENLSTINSKNANITENIEANALYQAYNNADYRIGILYDNNFGNKVGLRSSGSFPNNLIVKIDNFVLTPNRPNGQLDLENSAYNVLYGKQVDISINDSENSETYQIYAPNAMSFSSSAVQPNINIERAGNDLQWVEDNQSFGILVTYVLYDVDRFKNDQYKVISSGNEFIEDNGSYNIDHLIQNTGIKSIEITLTRANGVNFETLDNKNVFFTVQSTDAHYYVINN